MNPLKNHTLWPSMMAIIFLVYICCHTSSVNARSYYPPSKYEHNQQSRIKLNLGLHVPPIILKLPRMEVPQLVIGANIIKNPKAKPLVLNMPPPPSISFGDTGGYGGHGGSYGGSYQYAASGSTPTESLKASPSEYGLDLKAFSSDHYQNMMHPSAAPPQQAQMVPPPPPYPQYPYQNPAMMPPPPPQQMPYAQQSEQPEYAMPPMMPPHMMPPPPPPSMVNPMQPYPQPYYGSLDAVPSFPQERMGFVPPSESGMMAMASTQSQQMIPPPSEFKAPFQLLKNPGSKDFKLRLKPNAEIFDSEQLYAGLNDDLQNENDQLNEDYSKDYNAAPKITMPKYQHRN